MRDLWSAHLMSALSYLFTNYWHPTGNRTRWYLCPLTVVITHSYYYLLSVLSNKWHLITSRLLLNYQVAVSHGGLIRYIYIVLDLVPYGIPRHEIRPFASLYLVLPFKQASLIKNCKYKFIFRFALHSSNSLVSTKMFTRLEIRHASVTAACH